MLRGSIRQDTERVEQDRLREVSPILSEGQEKHSMAVVLESLKSSLKPCVSLGMGLELGIVWMSSLQ